MKYYLRYTENIDADIERGYSYHLTGFSVDDFTVEQVAEYAGCDVEDIEVVNGCYNQKLNGLCAFELYDVETLEEAIEAAQNFHATDVYNSKTNNTWVILDGVCVGDGVEGDTIAVLDILYINK